MTVNLNAMQGAVNAMKKAIDDLDKSFNVSKETVKETTKTIKEAEKAQVAFTRRTTIFRRVAKDNAGVVKFGYKTLKEFTDGKGGTREAGTALEYLAGFLSGSSEQLRIFGFEVSGVRRFLYGFMPAGTFSLLNRTATIFNTIGGAVRFFRGNLDDTKGSLKGSLKMMKSLLPSFSGFGRSELMKSSKKGMKFYDKKLRNTERALQGSNLSQSTRDELISARGRFQKRRDTNRETFLNQKRLRRSGMFNDMTGGFFKGIGSGKEFLGGEKGDSMKNILKKSPIVKMTMGLFTVLKGIKWRELIGGGLKKLFKGAGMFFVTVMRFTLYFTLMITAAFILFHALKTPIMEAFEYLKTTLTFAFAIIGAGFATIWEGISEIYTAFKNGDFFGVLMGVWTIVWGVLQIAGGLFIAVLGGLGALIVGFIAGLGRGIFNFFTDWKGGLQKNIGKVVILVGVILGLLFGWPIVIAGLIFAAVGALFKKLKFFGDGGVSSGGMAVVGERGPELVNLPRGSRVHSSTQSRKMSSSSNVFNITINARDTSDSELRRIADKIGNMVNNKVNRRTGSGTLG